MIDLRSDTVTRPTKAMRRAMADADVGDAVYREDPTVRELEERTADILGLEAALFMPSGTMTNQVAVRTHTDHGDEVIMDYKTHIHYYEVGGAAALSGVSSRMIQGQRGIFTGDEVKAAVRPFNIHYPVARLVCIENTHNKGGGSIWPLDTIADVANVARTNGLKMHMDGARLWHAAVATGIPEREYCRDFDSVSVCFSKGLGAPVGSVLAGEITFIQQAERFRKQFGGGMRQAGIIAAGALHALEHQHDRLAEDHDNARRLAEGLANIPGIEIDPTEVETNIVIIGIPDGSAVDLSRRLLDKGVYVLATSDDVIRAVTHIDISRKDIDDTIAVMDRLMV
jgi:threonine aldolase